MGIGAIYKELTFGGDQSGDYGLYISGAGAFNAPHRDVEMVTIPGRNGAFALDHGRFENIEVTYPAGVFGVDDNDFASKVADIRAWLCSKKGYVELTDEYNPSEYRLAVYKSGLDVDLAELKAGEFDLVFECMPQRFLSSGKNAQPIMSSGNTLNNPTLFNSRPLLQVDGYGKIGINSDEIEIISAPIGDVVLLSSYDQQRPAGTSASWTVSPDYSSMASGDPVEFRGNYGNAGDIMIYTPGLISSISGFTQSGGVFKTPTYQWATATVNLDTDFTFNLGTAASGSASFSIDYTQNGTSYTAAISISFSVNTSGVMTFSVTSSRSVSSFNLRVKGIYGVSSQSALGSPVYIDLDIGEAYKIVGGEMVSVNSAVSLGYEMPELVPGTNVITFDNTVTQLKIVPRWWTV